MDLKTYSATLFVKDIEASKKFYLDLLGLSIDLDFGKNVIFKNGFAIWEIKSNHIIPKTLGLDKISDSNVNRFELYFETENLSEIFESLKSKDVTFLHDIHEEPWGQQTIRFFDPDNHLIEIGESMRVLVNRFYNQGLTIEQVSLRTSVPIEEIKKLINRK
ncbi:MAG: VOC family protein [Bacteroidales bacterium]|jgi:catechol 2,3-dioxygenase-like lactoylglutathione lyase family enzyme